MPPGYEESVQQSPTRPAPAHAPPPDPPIYRDLIARWAGEGRTLPGRGDPEWYQVATTPVWPDGPLFED
ncbi:hypothetical protein [Streptomyces sp. NPDC002054]|uniref:hypothetical protein n=1 Tax=Streptomyces sp. NPDC002054 TaxID=3154663 RepID=UPI00331C7868